MNSLEALIKYLNGAGLSEASTSILSLLKLASVDQWRDEIEKASEGREEPFAAWFDDNGRAYVPIESSLAQKLDIAKKEAKDILEILNTAGMSWSLEDIVAGKNGQIVFNGKFARDKILPAYVASMYQAGVTDGLPLVDQRSFNKTLKEVWSTFWDKKDFVTDDLKKKIFTDIEYDEISIDSFIVTLGESVGRIATSVKNYFNSGIRVEGGEQKVMVVSMRPDDVAGMSTERRWSSCLDLDEGSNRTTAICEISDGGFVAYLVEPDDLDIKNPVARIWIRRFDSLYGASYAMPENKVYSDGRAFPEFKETLDRWIKSKQGKLPSGMYVRSGGEWSDTYDDDLVIGDSEEVTYDSALSSLIEPNINMEDISPIWEVYDNLYIDLSTYFDSDNELPLTSFHLTGPKFFQTREAADVWVRNHSSTAYKADLVEILEYNNDLSVDISEINDEEEPSDFNLPKPNHNLDSMQHRYLIGEGLDIYAWARYDSKKVRWAIRRSSEEEIANRQANAIRASMLTWLITNMYTEVGLAAILKWGRGNPEKLILLYEEVFQISINYPTLKLAAKNTAGLLFKSFPDLLMKSRENLISGFGLPKPVSTDSAFYIELYEIYSNLEEGVTKNKLRKEAIDRLRISFSLRNLKRAYSRAQVGRTYGLIYPIMLLETLSKDIPVGIDFEEYILGEFESLMKEPDSYINKFKAKEDLLKSISALNSNSAKTISAYGEALETAIYEGNSSFHIIYYALMNLLAIPDSFIPMLGKLYRIERNESGGSITHTMKQIQKLVEKHRKNKKLDSQVSKIAKTKETHRSSARTATLKLFLKQSMQQS